MVSCFWYPVVYAICLLFCFKAIFSKKSRITQDVLEQTLHSRAFQDSDRHVYLYKFHFTDGRSHVFKPKISSKVNIKNNSE